MENAALTEVPPRRIALLGAGGFIGAHVEAALRREGHAVRRMGRAELDLCGVPDKAAWTTALRDADLLINAAGVFRERDGCGFESVHARGPKALFAVCARLGVPVIQVSALGADADAATRFLATKHEADDFLLSLDVPSLVLQPSLVYGAGGGSAKLFNALASLPLVPLPGSGDQRIQPIHVEDLAAAIAAAVRRQAYARRRIAAVGPRPLTLREYLVALRRGMGLGDASFLPVPPALVSAAAPVAAAAGGLLTPDAWRMLQRGSTGDPTPLAELLGRAPRAPEQFIAPAERDAARREASLGWLLPIVRVSIAIVWLGAAAVSAGLYPVQESLAMLGRVGLHGAAAKAALYGAVLLDAALGLATLFRPGRMLWLLQIGVVVLYSAIIAVALPEQWLHPFGPMLKNLPILAALLLLWRLEPR